MVALTRGHRVKKILKKIPCAKGRWGDSESAYFDTVLYIKTISEQASSLFHIA